MVARHAKLKRPRPYTGGSGAYPCDHPAEGEDIIDA